MGCFSWLTTDTDRSISAEWSSRGSFPVYMVYTLDGVNLAIVKEENYEGYGIFGGIDYYGLVYMMNLGTRDEIEAFLKDNSVSEEDKYRTEGIYLKPSLVNLYPQLLEDVSNIPLIEEYMSFFTNKPVSCPYQGAFYDDDIDDCDCGCDCY